MSGPRHGGLALRCGQLTHFRTRRCFVRHTMRGLKQGREMFRRPGGGYALTLFLIAPAGVRHMERITATITHPDGQVVLRGVRAVIWVIDPDLADGWAGSFAAPVESP